MSSLRVKLSRSELSRSELSGSELSRSKLSRSKLSGSELSGSKFDVNLKKSSDCKIRYEIQFSISDSCLGLLSWPPRASVSVTEYRARLDRTHFFDPSSPQ